MTTAAIGGHLQCDPGLFLRAGRGIATAIMVEPAADETLVGAPAPAHRSRPPDREGPSAANSWRFDRYGRKLPKPYLPPFAVLGSARAPGVALQPVMHAGIDTAPKFVRMVPTGWLMSSRHRSGEGDASSLRKQWRGASAGRRIPPPDVGGLMVCRAAMLGFRRLIAHRLRAIAHQHPPVRRGLPRFAGVPYTTNSDGPVNWFTTNRATTHLTSKRAN